MDQVERVAAALEQSFKDRIIEAHAAFNPIGPERTFEQIGVQAPAKQVWLDYARVAVDAIEPSKTEVKATTHLLQWLPGAVTHCRNGSAEWCQSYIDNAIEIIEDWQRIKDRSTE